MRKILIVLLSLGIIVSWQIVQLDTANASGKNKKGNCSLAGTWITESEGGGKSVTTAIPLDPAGKRFALTSESFVPEDDLTFYGFYPDTINLTENWGVAVKSSKNTYDFSQYQYASDADNVQQYDIVVSGSTKLIDCDKRVTIFSVQVIDHIYGEPPFCFDETYTSQSVRLKVVPPCRDLPSSYPDFEE